MQYIDQRVTDPLTFTCYMTTNGQAAYTLYEDDGNTQAYRYGAFAKTTASCHIEDEAIIVRIEEDRQGYKPQREAYNIVVRVDGYVLQQRVKAGQGTVTVKLR